MRILAAASFLAFATLGHAQLTVSPQTDLLQLAEAISGPGVTIANPQIDCDGDGFGEFTSSGSLLGIEEGILLTSGTIDNAVGPNDAENTTNQQGEGGSSILNVVTGRTTRDACKFEFDIIPAGDTLRFDFVFGSEEYNEWVGSQYNDVFGFFISGPGITGDPDIGNDHNIALVPGTNQAVTINNVNNGSNTAYFLDNAGGQHIQYDGITQGLSAVTAVQPCATYHLKLIVADASDRKYDSGVFIAKVESNPVTMQLISAMGIDSLIEGCNNGVVRFTRQTVSSDPMVLAYLLHGTATNGTDYTAIGDTDPGVAKTITIPANQAYVEQPISTLADAIPENLETLMFILGNPDCPGSLADTLVVPLVDSLQATIAPATSMICPGGQVQLSASGGSQYTWTPADGLSAPNISNPVAQPSSTTTYTVLVQNGGCSRTLQTTVQASNMQLSGAVTRPLCNGDANGAINLSVVGGIPSYTYAWTGPDGFTATTEDITGLISGTYSVTVTDAACEKTQGFNVTGPGELGVTLTPSLLIFGQHISCSGGADGSINATVTGGSTAYSYLWEGPGGFTSGMEDLSNLGEGAYLLTVTDANGCTAADSTTLVASAPMVASITDTTDVSCANDGSGSATVSINGGMPAYAYSWNTVPEQTTATASGLAPGTYTVTASDQYGCTVDATAIIDGPTEPLSVQLTGKTNVACHGDNNGSATITITGGTPTYGIAWNTVPEQHTTTASGLDGGTYTATVTDANGCSTLLTVEIAEPASPLSTSIFAQENITCHGEETGSATINASGGTGPYAYSWNTTPAHNGASATGLAAGAYVVSVTDALGCQATQNVVITAPSAGLLASITASSNVLCAGGNNGSATVEVSGGTAPYTQQWNTTPPQTGTTASNLVAGSWQITVLDAHLCSTSTTVVITEPTPLEVSGTITPAQCQGAANGAVDVTTSAGTPPYAWSWTGPGGFSATTEDIGTLAAGGYTLVVTDGNGCTATRSFDVNQPGLFSVSATLSAHGNANVSCPGATDGTISLDVSGAVPPYSLAWTGPNGYTAIGEDIAGLAAGNYSVSITDQNGCSTSLDVVLESPAPIDVQFDISEFGGTAIACNGGSNGSISTTIAGGNPGYSFAWTGPSGFTATQENLTGLAAGTYELNITDDNGCTALQSVVLDQPQPLVASDGGTSPATCFGSNTGQATVHVTGGHGPYTYDWSTSPVQHAATATGLAAGSYTVSVTDANGCTVGINLNVGGPSAPLSVSLPSTTNVLCHMGQSGAATAQAAGGTAPYTYVWNTTPATNGQTASGLAAGTWTVTVTDAAGCSSTLNVVITQPAQPLAATVADVHQVTCFGDQDGSASILVTGGSGSYLITWNTTPVQTGSTITNVTPGNYTATIADANGCTENLNISVHVAGPSAPMTLTLQPATYSGGAHVSCPGSSDGSIDLTVTGGTPAYGYYWQDGSGGTIYAEDPTGLPAGTYHLTVGDAHGCYTDTVITLVPPVAVAATALVQSAVCHGDSNGAIDLTAAGGAPPYAFQWSGPDGFAASSEDLNLLAAGVYTAAITDANGCTSSLPFDVTEPGTFHFDASVTSVNCSNSSEGAIDITATGGTQPYQFDWTGPGNYAATTEDISGLPGGTYHVILTDENDCSALSSYTITPPDPLGVFAISNKNHNGSDISCFAAEDGIVTSSTFGGTPPYSYAWTGPNGFSATTADISGLASGTYNLTVTDANGCTVGTSITLIEPTALTATAVVGSYSGGSGTSCTGAEDGSIVLTPGGGSPPYTVSWSSPNGFTSSAWQITALAPGTYTAVITDLNGCSTSIIQTLEAPTPLALSLSGTGVTCNAGSDGALDLSAAGGNGPYTYIWTGPGAFSGTTQDLANAPAGDYSVTVTDANGCTATAMGSIAQPDAIQAEADIVTAACQGANTGSIDLSVTGGTGGHTFLWTGFPAYSATTEDISSLAAGVYSVTITDASGCSMSTAYNVGEPGLFNITAELGSTGGGYNVSCAAAADGTIDATVTGGTGAYSYFWTGPDGFTSIDPDISGLAAGAYTLTVHDQNGCNASANFTLTAPDPVSIGLIPTAQPSCSGGENGSIDASIVGGVAPYTASWTGPNGFIGIMQNLTGVGAGTYTINVADALGCTATSEITLTSPAGINATATPAVLPNGMNLSCALAGDGSIDLAINGGTMPYTVHWTGPNGFYAAAEDITNLAAGLYTANITDANGCTFATQTELIAPDPLALDITTSTYSSGNEVSCAGASDGSINLSISGGSPDYAAYWTGPGGFTSDQYSLQNLQPGTYAVTVADDAGCYASASVDLESPEPILTNAMLSDHGGYAVGCAGNDGSIDLTTTGGQAPFQYDWTGPNGFASSLEDLTDLIAGTYSVAISDANGCSINRSFSLSAPQSLFANLAVTSNECDLTNNGSIELALIGGVAPFTYAWTGPDGFSSADEDINGLASGNYEVAVSDAMGCSTFASAQVIAAAPIHLGLYASDYGAVNIPCHGDSSGTIELAVSGGFAPLSIVWNGPEGPLAGTTMLNNLTAGTYTVAITDDHGCVRDSSITLVEPDSLLATVLTPLDIACTGSASGGIDATVTGGGGPYVFAWRGPDSTLYSTEDLINVVAGDYELVVTDMYQCVNTMEITLTEPDSVLATSFTVSDFNGYGTSCAGSTDGSINLSAIGGTPGYTFSWTGPGGFTSTADSLSGLAAGTYVLTVTDANNCTATDSMALVPPTPITAELDAATFASGSHISCFGLADGSIAATITGGAEPLDLLWNGPDAFASTEATLDSLSSGTYCLTVQDTNQCAAEFCITLIEPDSLSISLASTTASCGLATGSVDASISGGSAPFETTWSNGAATEDLTEVVAGTYLITVTGANGCTATLAAGVGGSPAVDAEATVAAPLCHASASGMIDISVVSGTAPFSFIWGDGSTGEDLADAEGGDHTVTITDSLGCTWDTLITITAPDALLADTLLSLYADGYNVSTWGGSDGSIALGISGGTPPYTYAWGDGSPDGTRYGLTAGTYTVTVTDANGCSLELTVTLIQPDELEMPSGFTPNGDGNNDAFVVHGIDAYPENQLTVFNRWGNVVFEQLHYSNQWHGENLEGQQLPNGTYFVILRLNADLTLQHYVDLRR